MTSAPYQPHRRLLTPDEVAYLDHRLNGPRLTPRQLIAEAEDAGRRHARYLPSDLRDADYIASPYWDDEDSPRGGMVAALLAVGSFLAFAAILGYIAWRVVGG